MKIIKKEDLIDGVLPESEYIRLLCRHCGCYFELEEGDRWEGLGVNAFGDWYKYRCPQCDGANVYQDGETWSRTVAMSRYIHERREKGDNEK